MRHLLLASALLMAGCQAAPVPLSPTVLVDAAQATGHAIVVKPVIEAPGYHVQSTVVPYGESDVNLLVIQLYTVDGTTETAVKNASNEDVKATITDQNFTRSFTFSNLKPDTTYRIRAYAYSGTTEDPAALISTTDAQSYVDLTLTDNDAPTPTFTALKVKLVDKDFNGQAGSTGVTVTPGGLKPVANESITAN